MEKQRMNYVECAIIMAAGIGNRMRPITLTTPKPLVKVNGVRMIDTVIQGLHHNGIKEIFVVVGYLKEQFKTLEEEYEGLKLIENPYYDVCNNISSLYAAREHICNAIILDGDQIIYNDEILRPEFERSGYNAVWTDEKTDEWLLSLGYERHGFYYRCIRDDSGQKTVALFSHGGSSAAAMGHILNLQFPYACGLFHLEFTGITIIRLDRIPGRQSLPCLELANDGRHILHNHYHRLADM